MAQAAFFVNELDIVDKGEYLVLVGQRKCVHGHVIDQVVITVPSELKHLFRAFGPAENSADAVSSDATSAAVAYRLRQYFGNN